MAYKTTNRLRQILNTTEKRPNVILELEGYSKLLSVTEVYKVLIFDTGVPIPVGTTFNSKVLREDVSKIISIDGTTQTLSQSVEPDKGQGQGTSSITVRLVDINQNATRLISPGKVLPDILYRKARFYAGYADGVFPLDYNLLFSGVVTSIRNVSGFIDLTISHPDEIKRTEIFKQAEAKLTTSVDYFAATLGALTFTRKSDFTGTVRVEIVNSGGPSGSVVVSGGDITLNGVVGATTYGRLKELVEGDSIASQLVSVVASGDRNNTITAFPFQTLTSSSLITLDTVDGFLLPVAGLFRTYCQIDDEIIEYTGIDTVNKQLTGLTRAQLNSIGTTHKKDVAVASFYVLGDGESPSSDALELLKYILLSKGPEFYIEGLDIDDIVSLPSGLSEPNAIFFREKYLFSVDGVLAGDEITISGATNIANDVTALITQVLEYENGTFIKLADTVSLVSESPTPAVAKFKSKYNLLPDGAGVTPDQIDLDQLNKVKNRFSNSLARYSFYLKDTVKVKEFIEKELLFPSGLYSVPRQGKISCQFTAPPIFDTGASDFDRDAVIRPETVSFERTSGRYFYNNVVYKWNEDSLTDRFQSGVVTLSQDSINRIPAPTKSLNVFSKGLRDGAATDVLVASNTDRYISRYKYGAESGNVEVLSRFGVQLEIGDAIRFGDDTFQIPDTTTGKRVFKKRNFEIINREINWRTGRVIFKIIDTAFLGRRRYGLVSPKSKAEATGSSVSKIVLKKFFFPQPTQKEINKWAEYIGKQVLVKSVDDWDTSTKEVRTIVGFDVVNEGSLFIAPPLSFTPNNDTVVELAPYSFAGITDQLVQEFKNRYVYLDPTVEIVSVTSLSVLDVGADVSKFFVGSIVQVHSDDYTYDTADTEYLVESITGTEITLNADLPSGVLAGYKIDLIGFVSDEGDPYAIL